MRNLYIELVSQKAGSDQHVVVVTSPLRREGKTTVARGLAATATAHDCLAVVIELDHRKPALAFTFKDRLVSLNIDEAVSVENLPVNPGTLISSPRFPHLLNELRQRFDMIIFDVSPILEVRDAKLLVAEWGKTPPDALRAACEVLGDDVTGVVLNRVNYKDHARRGYGDEIQYLPKSA
jgi:Mrp family chromosome partitioning ATPase